VTLRITPEASTGSAAYPIRIGLRGLFAIVTLCAVAFGIGRYVPTIATAIALHLIGPLETIGNNSGVGEGLLVFFCIIAITAMLTGVVAVVVELRRVRRLPVFLTLFVLASLGGLACVAAGALAHSTMWATVGGHCWALMFVASIASVIDAFRTALVTEIRATFAAVAAALSALFIISLALYD
jgi:hypothetical protein